MESGNGGLVLARAGHSIGTELRAGSGRRVGGGSDLAVRPSPGLAGLLGIGADVGGQLLDKFVAGVQMVAPLGIGDRLGNGRETVDEMQAELDRIKGWRERVSKYGAGA